MVGSVLVPTPLTGFALHVLCEGTGSAVPRPPPLGLARVNIGAVPNSGGPCTACVLDLTRFDTLKASGAAPDALCGFGCTADAVIEKDLAWTAASAAVRALKAAYFSGELACGA